MDWTDIKLTVPARFSDTAEAIATGISGGGIYIEDYRDLESQVEAIAHVDLIEQDLLDKKRDEVIVHLYIAPDENVAEIADLMRDRLARAEVPYTMALEGVRQEDWENGWKQYYHAMDIGARLAVVPSWEQYDTDRAVITLDPGMAFGTGTHETTGMCVELIEEYVKPGMTVIDIGTGTGILAIAAAHMGAKDVLATDLDAVAVKVATENVAKNGFADTIRTRCGDLLEAVDETADVVVANIIADVIRMLAAPVRAHIVPGGRFICSGIARERKDEVVQALMDAGYQHLDIREKGEWAAIEAERDPRA